MKFSLRRTQRGVSLLELMLALAVIAILLIMATRYFTSANINQQVNNAVDQFIGVRGAATNYLNDNKNTDTVDIKSLVENGYLPKSYGGSDGSGTGGNPWDGVISVELTSGARSFEVTSGSIPVPACPILKARLAQNVNEALGESVDADNCATDGTITVTYAR